MHCTAAAHRAFACLAALLMTLASFAALAATVTVTTAADDLTPNDGSVSLREAISAINAGNDLGDPDITGQAPGTFGTNDTINFNIAGSGVHTITLTGPLPVIAKKVVINGYSQTGATPNSLAVGDNAVLLVRLDVVSSPGFVLGPGSSGSTIQGFSIVDSLAFSFGALIDIQSSNNVIAGNFLGLNPDGVTMLASGGAAVNVELTPITGNTIGGSAVSARNVIISEEGQTAVFTAGDNTTIRGNYIGTNAAGTAALGVIGSAISVNAGNNVVIGGPGANDGNVLGQWQADGIVAQSGAFPIVGLTIQGNLIGTDATGATAVTTGARGIHLLDGSYGANIVGNVVSAASVNGIETGGAYTGQLLITGNKIGTNLAGGALPNSQSGICIGSAATGTIGGTSPGTGNLIAFNGTQGITIGTAIGIAIRENSIFSNGGLGISLQGNCGVAATPTPNDVNDVDTGANNLQNFPVITSAPIVANQTTITGTLNSSANNDFDVDFFANTACDPSGNGEGQTFIGTVNITSNGSGNATFGPLTFAVPAGTTGISATATDSQFNSSEFSTCVASAPPLPTLSIGNVSQNEGNSGLTPFVFTVTLSAASASTVTVAYATADGTANAGSDYNATSGTLTFNPGVTTQTITVNVIGDTVVEPNETFFVNLSSPTNATIAAAQGTGTIVNDDSPPVPTLSINNVSQNEGNSGLTPFTFTVTLSAASASTVTVAYATADGTAIAGSDYNATSGTLTFNPGVTTQTITVNVIGDTTPEPNETFFVNLSGATNATIAVAQGIGTIVNDDAAPPAPNVVIPTLSQWGVILLVLLLGAIAAASVRRRR